MPRRQRDLTGGSVTPLPSVVASATRADLDKMSRIYNAEDSNWQEKCYRHYRICGEARFAAGFLGHALGKAELYVTDGAERLHAGPAFDALDDVFHHSEGKTSLLNAIGIHFTIAGECYLIGRHDDNDNELWEIRSVIEVKSNNLPMDKGGKWWIVQTGGRPQIDLTDDDVVIRMWIPDPANSIQADSPFRALLTILDEIEWLTKYVFAQVTSRLAGAGVWMVPEEIDFPPPPDGKVSSRAGVADSLMATLGDAMMRPLRDPTSPEAKIPVIVTAPGEHIKNSKWITFWSELDTEAKALRGEAIQRFALGMDLPMERILGMSSNMGTGGGRGNGVSHWGAWQIDEDTIKMHIEPMLEVVVSAITMKVVRPLSGDELAVVGYDTRALRLRPDRSKESLELWDRGLIAGEVVLRENGFDPENDAMDPIERKMWLLIKMATGSATPEMVAAAAGQLGVNVPSLGAVPNESRPTPSLMEHPERPATPDTEAAALLAASDALVYRALERAGNRLRQSGVRPPGVRAYETHTAMKVTASQAKDALADAWSCAPQVLEGHTADVEATCLRLHSYAVGLLTSSQPHTRDALAKWLTRVPVSA